MNNGYFIVAELEGELGERIAEVQRTFDPRLAASSPPHITIAGSSGVGPIALGTPLEEVLARMEPIAAGAEPMSLAFGAPMRFMQTNIFVLPLDPHGPLRALHERIAGSGLPFARARFTFSPHCTLSFYPTLSRDAVRQVLSFRADEQFVLDRIRIYRSVNPMPYRLAGEFRLG